MTAAKTRAIFKGAKTRREFIYDAATLAGSAVLLSSPLALNAGENTPFEARTVGQVIDLFLKEVPGAPFSKTVDTLKAGSRDIRVSGIVTTMFATVDVIKESIRLKANFIIAHEPTFYNHQDETEWLENDEVYRYKSGLLEKHNIAVWRCHDYIHAHQPDGIRTGVIKALGYEAYGDPAHPGLLKRPSITLKNLVEELKKKLGIAMLRYSGDLSQPCSRILLMPGAAGGKNQIAAIAKAKPDVVLCGELSEWETAEYIRDARQKGQPISLVILGHAASEEPGMEWMAFWLQEKIHGVQITHIPSRNPLSFI